MVFDLSFWRFVIFFRIAKTGTWGKDGDTWFLHIGTFRKGRHVALQIVIICFSLQLGFAR